MANKGTKERTIQEALSVANTQHNTHMHSDVDYIDEFIDLVVHIARLSLHPCCGGPYRHRHKLEGTPLDARTERKWLMSQEYQ